MKRNAGEKNNCVQHFEQGTRKTDVAGNWSEGGKEQDSLIIGLRSIKGWVEEGSRIHEGQVLGAVGAPHPKR